MLNDPTVTLPHLIGIFIVGTVAIVTVAGAGYYFFTQWMKKDSEAARRFRRHG